MSGPTARMTMVLLLAGAASALCVHSAAADGGAREVSVLVGGAKPAGHGAFLPRSVDRFTGTRFRLHSHHPEPRAFHRRHGLDRHATGRFGVHARRDLPLLQRRAPWSADLRRHSGRAFHAPHLERPGRHRFTQHDVRRPRTFSFQRLAPRVKRQSVLVQRPSRFNTFVRRLRQPRHLRDGKLIILSPNSDGFGHIVIIPSHGHWADWDKP